MKNTPLSELHASLGAKMAEFAGYNMPISYTGIKEEHFAVRNSVGIFDVSHMGEFIVRGPQALDFVQYVTSNDASKLVVGNGVQYSCFPNGKGGIVDDLLVYRLAEDQCAEGEQAFMLVVNASNMAKDWAWLQQHVGQFDCKMIDISEATCLLAIQGPKAAQVLQGLTNLDLANMRYYTFNKGSFAGYDNVIVSATGYTGSGGFEIYANSNNAVALWEAIMQAGQAFDIKPCGLGARDSLRTEMGYCLYGNEINDETSPLEAGLGWITKLNKSSDFIDRQYMLDLKASGVKRALIGFEMLGKRVPRHDMNIVDANGLVLGHVTSGTHSPSLDKAIGLALVQTAYAKGLNGALFVDIRGNKEPIKLTSIPFVTING